jgi:tripartite-type tricarboxylate transporter receptor subunit TctC
MTRLPRRTLPALAAALAAPLARPAVAQQRAITLVVPYAPGGGTDIAAREFANSFSAELGGQPVVIENRAGAAGYVGSLSVARARPDGQTLLFAVSTNIVMTPHLQAGERQDLANMLVPFVQTSSYQYVLVVHPRMAATNLNELIALLRQRPRGSVTFSSSGVGGNNHLAGLLFSDAVGVPLEHVSYRGTAPAILDVVNGTIDLSFSSPPPGIPLVREGRLRAIAVTGEQRMPQLPDIPTLNEAGLPGLFITGWHGVFAPNGTPAELLDRYEQLAKRATKTPRFIERLGVEGLEPAPDRPRAVFAQAVKEESAFWARKARELNLRADQ